MTRRNVVVQKRESSKTTALLLLLCSCYHTNVLYVRGRRGGTIGRKSGRSDGTLQTFSTRFSFVAKGVVVVAMYPRSINSCC